MANSKTFFILAAAFTLLLLISSEVSLARDLAETTQSQEDGNNLDHYKGHEHGYGHGHGYEHGGRHEHGHGHGHHGKPGHGGHPGHGAVEAGN